MAVTVPNTGLGHAVLTMKKAHFTTVNSGTYTDPIIPRDGSSKSTATEGFTTRLTIESAAGSAGTTTTAPTIDPSKVQ